MTILRVFFLFLVAAAGAAPKASAHKPIFAGGDSLSIVEDGDVSHVVYGCVKKGENHTVDVHFPKAGTEKRIQLLSSITEQKNRRRSLSLTVDGTYYPGCNVTASSHSHGSRSEHSHGVKALGTHFWEPFTQTGLEFLQCVPEGLFTNISDEIVKIRVSAEETSCVRFALSVGTKETMSAADFFGMDVTIARAHLWAGPLYYYLCYFISLGVLSATVVAVCFFTKGRRLTFELFFVALALAFVLTSFANRIILQPAVNISKLSDPEGEASGAGMTVASAFVHLLFAGLLFFLVARLGVKVRGDVCCADNWCLYFSLIFFLLFCGILGVQTFYFAPGFLFLALLTNLPSSKKARTTTTTAMYGAL